MVTERYSLNVTPGGVPLVLNISQYDVGLRQFIFTPYTNEGILPKQDMVTVTLEATKRDGNGIIHPCTYNDDGTITYVLQDQLAPVKGKVFSKIRLRGVDSENLGMAAIIWVVDQAAVDDDTQFSDSDVAAIEEWLRLGAEYVVRTESAAEAAAESEANAKASENAAKASETASKASETAAKASETAAKASENAAAASETNADISERNAYNSAANALVSERNAKDSEIRAKASENAAAASETVAVEKATEAVNTIDNFNSNLQDLVSEAVEGLYIHSDSVVIDKTLSIEGAAAEASETGKRIAGAMNMFPTAKATSLGPVVTYEGTVDGVPVKTFSYNLEPHQAGSGDPSPDNVRAITGYTSVDVTRTGKNLLDPSTKTTPSTAFVWYYQGTGYLFRAGVTYTLSLSAVAASLRIVSLDESTVLAQAATGATAVTYTPTVDTLGVIRIWNNGGIPEGLTAQLEIGSTATAYEPYQGQTESIPFPSEAGTVYGGTLVKNADGSGTLTVTWGLIDLGTLNWTYSATLFNGSFYTPIPTLKANTALSICSKYASVDTGVASLDKVIYTKNNGNTVYVKDSAYTDAATFKTDMAGVQLAYELATPTTYAISASDMAEIPTLLGDNTVWMSADGEFTSFEYRVGRIIDPTLTVEGASADAKATGEAIEAVKEIISDEDTITVTSNYAVGSLVRVGDALYETTTVVVTGETLNPGTNCTPTTIKDQLINLRAKLEMAPDSPSDGDGDYIVRQTNGENEYAPLASSSAISGLTTRMSTAETQIAQNADDIDDLKSAIEQDESDIDTLNEEVLGYVPQRPEWENGLFEASGYEPLPSTTVTRMRSKKFDAGEYIVTPTTNLRWEAYYYVSDSSGTVLYTFSQNTRIFVATDPFIVTISKADDGDMSSLDSEIRAFGIVRKNYTMIDIRAINKASESVNTDRYNNITYIDRLTSYSDLHVGNSAGVSIDTNIRFKNAPFSIRMVTNSAHTSSEIRINYSTSFTLLGTQEFELYLYVPDATKVTNCRISIPSSAWVKAGKVNSLVTGWNKVRLVSAGAGKWTDSTENTQIRVLVYHTSGVTETVYIGGLIQVKPQYANMIIIADGPYYTTYTEAYPALKALGVPIVWALDPALLDTSETSPRKLINETELELLAYDGISEFSFHSYDGTLMSSATAEEALADTLKCIRYLQQKGIQPNHIWRAAWLQNNCPNHELGDLEVEASASHEGVSGYDIYPFLDRYNIPRFGVAARDEAWMDNLFSALEREHPTVLLYFHGVSDGERDITSTMLSYFVSKVSAAITAGYLNPTTYDRLVSYYSKIE